MPIQMKKLVHVSNGSEIINPTQKRMAIMGVKGTNGVRNGAMRSGWVLRRTKIPPLTNTNANKVPMLAISAMVPKGTKPETNATAIPVIKVPT